MKMKKQILAFSIAFFFYISPATAQQNWTQSNTTSRGTQFYNSSGALGYSVRTNTGGGWAWQFVDAGNNQYFQVQFPSGNVGMGLNNAPWIPQTGAFEFRAGSALGSTPGSSRLLTCTSIGSSGSGTNYFQNNTWVRRDASGSDWFTSRLHNGISIDGSYLTPGTDTRTWWERSPFRDIQAWGNGNTTYMALNQGRLNIGTAPSFGTQYRLAVAGSIGAWGEVRVFTNGSSFPDYVFDADYKLRSLEDTESYIKENHHLPEVPSAAEVAKEGMSLNGISEILLKKVEELTLHLIEMKKDSEAIRKENEELKKRLEALEDKR
jgi:hypothetical protein